MNQEIDGEAKEDEEERSTGTVSPTDSMIQADMMEIDGSDVSEGGEDVSETVLMADQDAVASSRFSCHVCGTQFSCSLWFTQHVRKCHDFRTSPERLVALSNAVVVAPVARFAGGDADETKGDDVAKLQDVVEPFCAPSGDVVDGVRFCGGCDARFSCATKLARHRVSCFGGGNGGSSRDGSGEVEESGRTRAVGETEAGGGSGGLSIKLRRKFDVPSVPVTVGDRNVACSEGGKRPTFAFRGSQVTKQRF